MKTLHGELDISAKPGQGVNIHIEFPRELQFGRTKRNDNQGGNPDNNQENSA